MIVRCIGGLPGVMAAPRSDEKLEFVEELGAATNRCVMDVLLDCDSLPLNILSIDYVNDEVIERILELNKFTKSGAYNMNKSVDDADSIFPSDPDLTHVSLEVPPKKPKAIEVRETNM